MRVESHLKVDRDSLLGVASYGITGLRLLIATLGAVMIFRGAAVAFAVSSIALVMLFDYLDGATFDRSSFSMVREWRVKRRIADSLSDRLVIQIICVPLFIKNSSFAWFYLPILAREIAISGFVSKEFARGFLVYPRSIAKIACATIGLAVISFLTLSFSITFVTTAVMITLSTFAIIDYNRRVKNHKASTAMRSSIGSLTEIF